MIINDDISFGFTITNLLDDLTKIIILNEMEHNFTEFPIMFCIMCITGTGKLIRKSSHIHAAD